jgi:hypothetical protein
MFSVQLLNHAVPAQEGTFHIVAARHYAMPITEILHPSPGAEGDVKFVPKPDRVYIVDGAIERTRATVWIGDVDSGEIIGKIEGQ